LVLAQLLYLSSAFGAVFKISLQARTSIRAPGQAALAGSGAQALTLGAENAAATLAFQKHLPFFQGDQRNKKQAKVVILPFQTGGRQSADRAGPGIVIQFSFFGLNPAYENESPCSRPIKTLPCGINPLFGPKELQPYIPLLHPVL
jgi:hypothetical protein